MSRPQLRRTGVVALLSLAAACADATSPNAPSDFAPSLAINAAQGPGGIGAGLAMWLRADAGIGVPNGAAVTAWRDQSGNQRDALFNAANVFGELAPTYRASNASVKMRPSVRFDGQQALEADLRFLAGSNYTIIAVNGRDRAGFANFWLAGASGSINQNLVLG
ncbi:MAG: hypothetical protein ABIP66_08770, partial [Gemmatimonadaceae bacterium]